MGLIGGLVRTGIVFGAAAAGSWIGLGKPPLRDVRAQAYNLVSRANEAGRAVEDTLRVEPRSEAVPPPPSKEVIPNAVEPGKLTDPPEAPLPRLNPSANVGRAWLLAEGPAILPGDGHRYVTLSFDDGPSPEATAGILRLLARERVKASFFLIGRYLEGDTARARKAREAAKAISAAGHLIGNHGYSHEPLTRLARKEA